MTRRRPGLSAFALLVTVSAVSPVFALDEPDRLWLVGERAVADGLPPEARGGRSAPPSRPWRPSAAPLVVGERGPVVGAQAQVAVGGCRHGCSLSRRARRT